MKAPSKIKAGLEARILERVNKIKERKGYRYFQSNIAYPENEKKRLKYELSKSIEIVQMQMPEIKGIIKSIKRFVPQVWEQDSITAVYLLMGKAYSNLETMLVLAKEGHNIEIVELARSANESLDLAFLFLEEEGEEKLKEWFKGKIIANKDARKVFHKVLNSGVLKFTNLPVYDAKTDVYSIYSEYTHSGYGALIDAVDIFHEDFDYERISGLHYTLRNFEGITKNLAISILIELKNIFLKYKDLDSFDKVETLLKEIGKPLATMVEVKEIYDQYSKK